MFSRYTRPVIDHFEPEVDPQTQKSLRGLLEKFDYTAYVSNQHVVTAAIGAIQLERVQRLAVAAAHARARWVAAALDIADKDGPASAEATARLVELRSGFEELSAAYEALRRLVERGYVKLGKTAEAPAAPESKAG